ncbi:MAG: TatD family hydrolase [Gammaproteobacteria bacterium]|nr:TatD family hydrolase [Gammaproteobacteria bacterium]
MLVDSHCHIPLLEEDINVIFANARKLGVDHMLCVSIDLETFPRVLQLAQKYSHVFASVGVHPNSKVFQEPAVQQLAELAAISEVIAVGETGLDYFRSKGDLEWQRERFRTHIRVARLVQKPLIIHSRNARDDVLQILKEEGADTVGGIMHCFVDDWETAKKAISLNFLISFSGIVTFKNAKEVQEVARQVPIDRLLIETDSPYLAPVPYRGKPNQPAYVRYVAEFLAKLRGEDFETFAEQTTRNFFQLFKL